MDLQTISLIGKYATPEVMTVFGALATAWIGWKVMAKGIGLVSMLSQKLSFMAMVSFFLVVSGFGTMGLGGGELLSRMFHYWGTEVKSSMSNADLKELAKDSKDQSTADLVLGYAVQRDLSLNRNEFGAIYHLAQKEMLTKGTPAEKEQSAKILLALVDLAKSQQKDSRPQEQLVSLDKGFLPSVRSSYDFINETPIATAAPELKNKDTLLSMPFSFCLLGIGAALAVCGVSVSNKQ
jgi:hypothetical protein